jgi:hypothetical protein
MENEKLNNQETAQLGIGVVSTRTFPINYGTMDKDCEHDIEKLYNKNGDYKADYCKKCKGVY